MGFISRLKKVTGKAAEEQEARIRARDAATLAEADAILDSELAESPSSSSTTTVNSCLKFCFADSTS